jgi:hypothetical protein
MSESEMYEGATSEATNISGIFGFICDFRDLIDCSAPPQNDEGLMLSRRHEGFQGRMMLAPFGTFLTTTHFT